jgi:hypothetical protein
MYTTSAPRDVSGNSEGSDASPKQQESCLEALVRHHQARVHSQHHAEAIGDDEKTGSHSTVGSTVAMPGLDVAIRFSRVVQASPSPTERRHLLAFWMPLQ